MMRPGLYSDDSVTRRVNRENILLLGGGRALLMQLAHPKVAAAVDEHSDFRSQPIRRLRRTIRMTMAIVFGDRETALAAARSVNQAHGRVRGEGYRALDPDLLRWVHATLVDSALVTYETFVKPLAASEREDFYQESKLLGEILGIPREQFPAAHRDFNDYLAAMTSVGPVRVGPGAMDLARLVTRPRLRLVPGRQARLAAALPVPPPDACACTAVRCWSGGPEKKTATMRGLARGGVRPRPACLISPPPEPRKASSPSPLTPNTARPTPSPAS